MIFNRKKNRGNRSYSRVDGCYFLFSSVREKETDTNDKSNNQLGLGLVISVQVCLTLRHGILEEKKKFILNFFLI